MQIGLNQKQLEYLKQVYKIRFNFLRKVFWGTIPFWAYLAYFVGTTIADPDFPLLAQEGIALSMLITFLVGLALVTLIMSIAYIIRLKPLKKDIAEKSGEQVDYLIIRKAFFPITNQYFFFFAETQIPNIEIDHATFAAHSTNTYFYIYRSLHAKVVFENYMRFDLL